MADICVSILYIVMTHCNGCKSINRYVSASGVISTRKIGSIVYRIFATLFGFQKNFTLIGVIEKFSKNLDKYSYQSSKSF